jgi:hypothetical protein
MTPVKSTTQQQEFAAHFNNQIKLNEKEENLLWQPSKEQREKSKMTKFMGHINKQYNLSNKKREALMIVIIL